MGFWSNINIKIIAPDDSQTDSVFLVSIVRAGFWAGFRASSFKYLKRLAEFVSMWQL